MSFYQRNALIPIYQDDSQNIVILKCVQFGGSEWLLCAMMSKLYQGWSILYSLPTEALRNTYVANRIDPLLQQIPFYKYGIKTAKGESDAAGLKHIWKGSARFVGSNSKVGFVEFPADMVIIDELDTSNIKNLTLAPDRLQASKHKYFWQIGNPTIPKYGIHRAYVDSDQKQWHIKCPACNESQPLDFFKNVVREIGENQYELIDNDYNIACRKCGGKLDRLSVGEWVARYPDRGISGYHVSQLFSPTVSVQEVYNQFIAGQFDQTTMQVFYNSCLGLPYHGTGDKLTAALLESVAMDDYLMPTKAKDCTAGIDVNYPFLNVRISEYDNNKRKAVFIGKVRGFDRLSALLKRYDVRYAVIDNGPEWNKIEEFQHEHDYVWACQYTSTQRPDDLDISLIKAEEKARRDDIQKIVIDRTMIIDAMVADTLQGNNRIPKNFRSLSDGEWIDEIEASTRILVETETRTYYAWDEGNNADHSFHAETYDYIASLIRDKIGDMTPGYA